MTNIEKLQKLMIEESVTTCLISDCDAMKYYINTCFHTGERLVALLVFQSGRCKLVLNDLFPSDEIDGVDIVRLNDTNNAVEVLNQHLVGDKIAIDKTWSAGFLLALQQIRKAEYVNATHLSDLIRSVKTEEELVKMREASKLNDAVMAEVRKMIKVGKTEKQIEQEILEAFRRIANSEPSFETIVAFQENCANPHAVPSDKVLEEGMSVIVDMGCKYQNYCSDMTRTFFVKENTMKEIYDTVLKANLAGIAAVKPGVMFKEIDLAARKVIEDAGYGPYFIHRLGHGIGLTVHEPYDVSAVDEVIVKEGMCFSIEPGIYLPGVGGVRIEDLVAVTKDGCEVLNSYPKDQEVID